ncbi:MAG TPA: DUF4912 domain-containing protein [Polyangia bacterium]|nr:DUF4912 domain-containing protein [Polyangia bacterium]
MTSDSALAAQILVIVGQKADARLPSFTSDELFNEATRNQLIDCATTLGLTGVSKMVKEELAGRVKVAFDGLRAAIARTESANGNGAPSEATIASFPPKFDLGPAADAAPMPQNIPWGYGYDRVTAMVVDPERLFVYWEVTDEAVAAARAGLGPAGAGAWLNLRVYDITGRLFDGTNAHSYFDHRVERHDRQWFFVINKPTSSATIEVGLKSEEGYFAKIVRSGRVEFPRREPAPGSAVEWLTVRTSGEIVHGSAGDQASAGATGGGAPGGGGPGPEPTPAGWEDWTHHFGGFPAPGGNRVFGKRWEWQEQSGGEWKGELERTEWAGPLMRTEWESGPFTYPVEVPSSVVEMYDSGELSVRTENGRVHVVYGPWQVVIRGLGARAERRILGTWQYKRQVAVSGGFERFAEMTGQVAPGSSEWMSLGASERAWLGSSELMFGGASELWMIGASEMRLGGASERMYAGASERRMRGASEKMYAGASERLLRGASEWSYAGASEKMMAGASERALGGSSELSYAGASEKMAASAAGGEAPSIYPKAGE